MPPACSTRGKRQNFATAPKKVLTYARALARSGEHADYQTILPQLAALEDFEAVRSVFADRAICAQLDLLCARARKKAA